MEREWKGRKILALALRIVLFLAPGVMAWFAVRSLSALFLESDGWARFPLWIAQAIIVSLVVAKAIGMAAQRFVPLPGLLALSLVFPDEAPNRFGVALRAGSTKKLKGSIVELPDDAGEAAREAIALVTGLNGHDRLTRGHIERVRAYSEMIGAEMGLSDDDLNMLRWGTLLHDVGKLEVPPEILNKPGRPDKREWEILQRHPGAGGRILAPLAGFLGPWGNAAADHHERWDGTGYPEGKEGLEISLAGRICAVADAFDVITSKRSYKEPLPAEEARNELVKNSGSQFDPTVVRAFLRVGHTQRSRTGVLGWLFEMPQAIRLLTSGVSMPAAVVVGAVAASTAAMGGYSPMEPLPSGPIAFEDSTVEAREEILPTTTLPPLTTTTAAPERTTGAPATTLPAVAPTTTAIPTTTTESSTTTAPTTTSTAGATTTTAVATTSIAPTTTTIFVQTGPVFSTIPIAPTDDVFTIIPAPTTTTTAPTTTTTTAPTATTAPTTTTTAAPTTTTTAAPTTTTTTAPSYPVATGTGFVQKAVEDVGSIGFLENSSPLALVFFEGGPTILNQSLPARSAPTFLERDDMNTFNIPAGTTICTWIVHADQSEFGGTATVDIDLGQPILGITLNGDSEFLQSPLVEYPSLDGIGRRDFVRTVGTTFAATLDDTRGVDTIRVVTSC